MTGLFLQPGDFGVVRTNTVYGAIIRWVTHSEVNHAIRYIGDNQIVEAKFWGTKISPLSTYENVIWSSGHIVYTEGQRAKICTLSRKLAKDKVDYSITGVVILGLAQLGFKNKWLASHLVDRDHMFCSQEIDYVDEKCWSYLFEDGRLPGDVTPQDLLGLFGRTTI